jgi:hypothetical protein
MFFIELHSCKAMEGCRLRGPARVAIRSESRSQLSPAPVSRMTRHKPIAGAESGDACTQRL